MDVATLAGLLRETAEHHDRYDKDPCEGRLVGLVRALSERSRAREQPGGGGIGRRGPLHGGETHSLSETEGLADSPSGEATTSTRIPAPLRALPDRGGADGSRALCCPHMDGQVPRGPGTVLRGRAGECAILDELLGAVRRGESGVLVLRGEAGLGKTAMLDYASRSCEGCRVIRAAGVESEMELPFAALHQLVLPLLEGVERLPDPQRDALRTAFGQVSGQGPDRFLVGLAVLTLLSDAAEQQPLVCIVDDAQWLDRSSAQVLSFTARRLQAESVVILFAERDHDQPTELAGLPERALQRLSDADARELLASSRLGPVRRARRPAHHRRGPRQSAGAPRVAARRVVRQPRRWFCGGGFVIASKAVWRRASGAGLTGCRRRRSA